MDNSISRLSAQTGEGSGRHDTDMRQSTTRSVSSAASLSVRSNQKTLSFFKNLIGKRSTDYHDDAAQVGVAMGRSVRAGPQYRSAYGAPQAHPTERAGYSPEEVQTELRPSCWQSFCQWISIPADLRKNFCRRVINSRMWRSACILFTIALVFGAQVRDLFCPKAADDIFDYLFLAIIGFFTFDILMRVDVEPNYFVFRAFGRGQMTAEDSTSCMDVQLGSFIFWCEVGSTLALLYEISLINKREFGLQTIAIALNEIGAPVRESHMTRFCCPQESTRSRDILLTFFTRFVLKDGRTAGRE